MEEDPDSPSTGGEDSDTIGDCSGTRAHSGKRTLSLDLNKTFPAGYRALIFVLLVVSVSAKIVTVFSP